MAIKGGQLIHVGNGTTVVNRVQTGGPGQVNIPTEKINELGNYKSVATVRDTPDLTFSLESFDVSTEVEALVTGSYKGRSVADGVTTAASKTLSSATAAFTAADAGRMVIIPGAGVAGAELVTTIDTVTDAANVELIDAAVATLAAADVRITVNGINLALARPVDFAGQFKFGKDAALPFKVVSSVALPFLYLEQMSYRFGLRDNATQSASLRGDSIFYNPGPTFVEEAAGTGIAAQAVVTAHPAYQVGEGDARRVLSVTVGTKRLNFGADYVESYGAEVGGAAITTVTLSDVVPVSESVRIIYASPDEVQYPQSTHPSVAVLPAAVKGRDIEIYVGGYNPNDVPGSQVNKLTSVQAITTDWRVTINKDEEFGNYYAVGLDFDVPQTNGSIDILPRDPADLLLLLRKAAGIADPTKIIGTASSVPLPLDIVIKNAEDNSRVIKRLHVADARFTVPGLQGRVQQKTTVSLPFESDEGDLIIFER